MLPVPLQFLLFWHIAVFLVLGAVSWIVISILRARIRALQVQVITHEKERESVLLFLHRMGEMVTREADLETTLEIITEFIIEETKASAGAIYLMEEDKGDRHLRARVVRGLFPPLQPVGSGYVLTKRRYLHDKVRAERIALGEGVVGAVAQTGEGLLIADAKQEPRIPKEAHELVPLETMMLMPLKIRDRLVGVSAVVNKRAQGQAFTEQDMGLLAALADQAAVTVNIVQLYDELSEKQRIESELKIAMDFQRLLLPAEMPEAEGFEIAAYCTPALEMGGDYYDFIRVDDRHLGIVIADVSGKGIPGALIMAMVRSALRAEAPGRLQPAEVLRIINQRVYEDTRENVFITMTYAILDLVANTLRFARAGHEPLITCPRENARPVLYTPEGIALGLVEGEVFDVIEDLTVDLSDVDLAVLYTDGVIEAMNERGEEYGQERFFGVLQTAAAEGASALIQTLLADITDFTRGIPQHDDITLVTLRRRRSARVLEAPVLERQTG